MNPDTYAALYGPGRPAPVPAGRKGETVLAVLAGLVWAAVLTLLAWPAFAFLLTVTWLAAEGEPVDGLLLAGLGVPLAATALLALLARTPVVRRMSMPGRFLTIGAVALPIALGILTWLAHAAA
ncbi:hypothetical protein ACFY7C_34820 [Streptomyces sp. NPDC012769]|uniref:hypothetical protein n=1 Tax=Streptomyces sp. NPDC012769 TaxID=3364848 RepID=UPI0036B9D9E0